MRPPGSRACDTASAMPHDTPNRRTRRSQPSAKHAASSSLAMARRWRVASGLALALVLLCQSVGETSAQTDPPPDEDECGGAWTDWGECVWDPDQGVFKRYRFYRYPEDFDGTIPDGCPEDGSFQITTDGWCVARIALASLRTRTRHSLPALTVAFVHRR